MYTKIIPKGSGRRWHSPIYAYATPLAKAFRLTDGEGLHLEVRPTGKRVWRFRYRLAGKPGLYALGRYLANETPEAAGARRAAGYVTLLEARAERDRCRALVRTGTTPIQERDLNRLVAQQSSDSTFANIAREWMAGKTDWSDTYRSDVTRIIENDLIPELGKMPIRAIQAAHLLLALDTGPSILPVRKANLFCKRNQECEVRFPGNVIHDGLPCRWRLKPAHFWRSPARCSTGLVD